MQVSAEGLALPFLDIDHSATLNHLNKDPDLRLHLEARGVTDLDRGAFYSADRTVTRLLANWAYVQTDELGGFLYGGLRYKSRLGKEHTCWAIFEGRCAIQLADSRAISKDNLALLKVADMWDLTIH